MVNNRNPRGVTVRQGPPPLPGSGDIWVDSLRTTFFWPLTLDVGGGRDGHDVAGWLGLQSGWLTENGSPWQAVPDGMQHLPLPPETEADGKDWTKATPHNLALANAYGEYVYFHDFLQRSLFGRTDARADGPMRMFRRDDIASVEVEFFGSAPRTYRVERVNLYLFSYGAAVVVVQCHSGDQTTLTLSDALKFNDGMRRSHHPFFEAYKGTLGPRQLPERVQWRLTNGQKSPDPPAGPPPYVTLSQQNPDARRVLPRPYWRWLLNGDGPERLPMEAQRKGLRWRHFSDDRFPIQTTIILSERRDYYNLTDGLWARLAFVDPPGTDPTPYAAAFIAKTFDQHCYDRYHHPKDATADAPVRYLMCDYAMTAVTYRWDRRPGKKGWPENTYCNEIAMHMQRHYYQMFLLQVVERAVMLGFSSRITEAVRHYASGGKSDDEDKLSEALQRIEKDFLHFVHLFRFTGVSGQLQAGELFAQLRAVMRSDGLFQDIRTELETAVNFLTMRENTRSSDAAERLNVIASLAVVVGIVIALLSMNLFTTEDIMPSALKPSWSGQILIFCITLGTGSAIAIGIHKVLSIKQRKKGHAPRPSEAFVLDGLRAFLGLSFVIGCISLSKFIHGP